MTIFLIRHAATAGNLEHRYIGATDECLCFAGICRLQEITPPVCNVLFSSPMRRCAETASILYPNRLPIFCDDLRECNFGDFEGKNYLELNGNPAYQAWIDSGGTAPFPHGESPAQFKQRCADAFYKLAKKSLGTAVFVIHGGTIMAICEAFHGGDYYSYHVPNSGGFRAKWDGTKLTYLEKL